MNACSGTYRSRRVGVLYGGPSAERDVSLVSGTEVAAALRGRGYASVALIDVGRDLPARLREQRIDAAFIALHGKLGEDGCVQGLLEVMGIPYTGSGVTASALCMDKVAGQARAGAQPRPDAGRIEVVSRRRSWQSAKLPLPAVVKPRAEGSSIGVTIVRRRKDLAPALRKACRWDRDALVERLRGRAGKSPSGC